jgi:hypothetical protein
MFPNLPPSAFFKRAGAIVWAVAAGVAVAATAVWVVWFMVAAILRPEFPKRADDRAGLAADRLSRREQLRRFHHSGADPEADRWSTCVECHGPMPHVTDEATRSYANMHGSMLACQTCHVALEPPPARFAWYSLDDGAPVPAPDTSKSRLGEYGAVLIPVDSDGRRLDAPDREALGVYNIEVTGAGEPEKQKLLDRLHSGLSENAVECAACHSAEPAAGYVPYESVGYSAERARELSDAWILEAVGAER